MDNNFQEQLFEAIETIVDSKLNTLSIGGDIVAGTVVGKIKEHLYKIQCEGFVIECIAENNKEYILNDVVYIYIPNSDYSSNEKIILGKFDNTTGSNLFENLMPLNQMTQNVVLKLEESLATNVAIGTEDASSASLLIPSNLFNKNYNRLCLQANFEATGLETCQKGEYGIRLELYNNGILINSSNFVFSCLDEVFCTNPYSIIPSLTMSKMFKLENIPIYLVNEIKVVLYVKNNFEQNGNIALTNLKIVVGEDISRYINKPISLYLDYQSVENYGGNGQYSPIIHALLVDQTTLTPQNELLENQTIRWYEYILGHPGDEYGGLNWRYIDTEDNNLLLDQFVFNENSLSTEIKALWCEDLENGLLSIIGESEPIVFKHVLNNYLNNAKDTVITLVGKTQLPVYNSNNVLQYIESNNYNYKMQLLDNNIEINSIEWKVSTNGLIRGFLDNETGELISSKIFTGDNINTQITIVPQDDYEAELADSAHNIITCIVNDIYSAEIKIEFQLLTTQGTNYIFQIKPKDSSYLLNIPGSSQIFEVNLTMADGTIVPIIPNRLSWSWYQYDIYQYEEGDIVDETIPIEDKNYITIEDTSLTEATIVLQKAFDIEFAGIVTEDYQQTILNNNEQDVIETPIINNDIEEKVENDDEEEIVPPEENEDDVETSTSIVKKVITSEKKCNTHILQAKYLIDAVYKTEKQEEITRTIELVAYYPIKVVGNNLSTTDLNIDGIFELNWNNEGKLTTFPEEDYEIDDGLITQEAFFLSTAPEAIWSAHSENNIGYYIIDSYSSNDNTFYYLRLPQGYGYISEKVSITAIDASGNLLYQQPLMLTLNNFSIDMTNKWAGGVVTIDEEAATIMATTMGAGHKNTDNSFTGVLMGDIQLNQQSDIDSGLFGFNEGKMVFKLNKDAEFFVGSDQNNYISFKDNFFDLKTQTLKLNALANNFIIDSAGETQVEYKTPIWTIQNGNWSVSGYSQPYNIPNTIFSANNNLVFTKDGKIYANEGEIGGWQLKGKGLFVTTSIHSEGQQENLNTLCFIHPNLNTVDTYGSIVNPGEDDESLWNIWIGTDKESQPVGKFGVTTDGKIYASEGKIASWNLNNNYLTTSNSIGNFNYTVKIGANFKIESTETPMPGSDSDTRWVFYISSDETQTSQIQTLAEGNTTEDGEIEIFSPGKFGITAQGKVCAINANISNWKINKNIIYKTYVPNVSDSDWSSSQAYGVSIYGGQVSTAFGTLIYDGKIETEANGAPTSSNNWKYTSYIRRDGSAMFSSLNVNGAKIMKTSDGGMAFYYKYEIDNKTYCLRLPLNAHTIDDEKGSPHAYAIVVYKYEGKTSAYPENGATEGWSVERGVKWE